MCMMFACSCVRGR
uniref:Uncharacterized protein n=1 Tax=Arundo donax TaxID=35708 RepID=A0A0A9C8S1_ARUDO